MKSRDVAGPAASGLVNVSDKEHTMSSTTSKHRATEPLQAADRPQAAPNHRAGRSSDLPIAALLGLLLLVVAAYLAVRR